MKLPTINLKDDQCIVITLFSQTPNQPQKEGYYVKKLLDHYFLYYGTTKVEYIIRKGSLFRDGNKFSVDGDAIGQLAIEVL